MKGTALAGYRKRLIRNAFVKIFESKKNQVYAIVDFTLKRNKYIKVPRRTGTPMLWEVPTRKRALILWAKQSIYKREKI